MTGLEKWTCNLQTLLLDSAPKSASTVDNSRYKIGLALVVQLEESGLLKLAFGRFPRHEVSDEH
jgi:hypothetical protein